MNNERIATWQGSGWYACRIEYCRHIGEWAAVYYFIDDTEELPDESDRAGLGAPTWIDENF